ncbi:MAG: hypothetical protein AABY22_36000 [Nanoarchaeota archaeon]
MINIFSDFHHGGLYFSQHLLFEKRLGYKLFRPLGLEWAEEGWWKLHEPYNFNLDTAKQYLQIKPEYKPMDGTVPLNRVVKELPTHYEVEDLAFGYIQKCITLNQFKEMDIDIIIASYAPHIPVYAELIQKYKPKAKLIHQQGNEWYVDFSQCKNLLASVLPYIIDLNGQVMYDVNSVFYHQEFSLDLFKPEYSDKKIIRSFVNTLSTQSLFHQDWIDFLEMEKYLPEYKFESYGAGCREGVVNEQKELARLMRQSKWGFMCKENGDGFGHILWNFAFCGKPLIIKSHQYKNKLGGLLMIDGETCFDIDKRGIMGVVNSIRNITNDKYDKMCQTIYEIAKKHCNFDEEELIIRNFLDNLK